MQHAPDRLAGTHELVTAMRDPATYPHDVSEVELIETHLSWVFLTRSRAFKVKKPIALAFVDQRDPARRRQLCDDEVRLNRRLTSDLYLGVRGLARRGGRFTLTAETAPDAEEFAVEMRRFAHDDTLAARIQSGDVGDGEIAAVGARLARFHLAAPALPADGATDSVVSSIEQNLTELSALAADVVSAREVAEAQRFATAFVASHRPVLDTRAAAGLVRDGHGDLRTDHVLFGDAGVEVFDCIEFDPALRRIDVGADLAFLAMDLEAKGGRSLATGLVDSYRRTGGDPGPDDLLAFFVAYRAWVRCKVACVRRSQLEPGDAEAEGLGLEARDLARLARRAAWRARGPVTLIVCGPTASGKTTLAARLADESGFEHLSSDVLRKQQRGIDLKDAAPQDAYEVEANEAVYSDLGARAGAMADGVIVDGTFRHSRDRDAFAAAFGSTRRPPVFIECRAALETTRRWAAARSARHDSVSDAGAALVDIQRSEFAALDEVGPESHLIVRTDRSAGDVTADVKAFLDVRLAEEAPSAR